MKYMIYEKETGKPIRKEPYSSLDIAQSVVDVLVGNDLYDKNDLQIKAYVTKIENPVNKIEKETNNLRTRKADKEAVAVMDRQTFISQHLSFFGGKVVRSDSAKSKITQKPDVSINLVKNNSLNKKNGIKDFNIVLRNKTWEHFEKPRMSFAILENRLYFQDTTSKDCVMISWHKTNPDGNRCIRVNGAIPQAEEFNKFVGNFSLKFDNMLKLYYVEHTKSAKEEK